MTQDAVVLELGRSVDAAMACYVAGRFEEFARIFGDVLPRIVSPRLPLAWELYGDA